MSAPDAQQPVEIAASTASDEAGEALCFRSAVELARAIAAREISAVEVTRAHLARIAAVEGRTLAPGDTSPGPGRLGAYLRVDAKGALASARAVDEALAAGRDVGPLAGVPVALKDIFVTRDLETTCGSKILAGWIPPYEGTAVARLREAGAVILGKLNMDEFAMGSSNEKSAFGACRNPWDLSRVPGGSSGGSAAAVTAGLCAIALGTDTGGSIRQPAALSGCVGIKPTYGRVSRYGVIAYASSLDQVGPLARTAEDCALALRVISGLDPHDSTSLPHPVPDYLAACASPSSTEPGRPLAGLRVGVPEALFGEGLDPAIAAAVRAALATLEQLGARTVPVELPHARYAIATYYLIAPAEASSNLARYDGVRYGLRVQGPGQDGLGGMYSATRAAGFGDEVKRRIMLGTYALRSGYYDAYYLRAQKVRTLIQRDYLEAFAHCDLIATPTSPVLPWRLGEKSADPLAMYLADVYTISANLAGLPGLSVPVGFVPASDGDQTPLPVGMQLLGPALGEAQLLRTAAHYQAATDFHRRRPPMLASSPAPVAPIAGDAP